MLLVAGGCGLVFFTDEGLAASLWQGWLWVAAPDGGQAESNKGALAHDGPYCFDDVVARAALAGEVAVGWTDPEDELNWVLNPKDRQTPRDKDMPWRVAVLARDTEPPTAETIRKISTERNASEKKSDTHLKGLFE